MQSEPAPQLPSLEGPAPQLEALDIRRLLLVTAGALIGVSLVQSLSANPATAGWMSWLSGRLLIVFGAFVGNRLFGGVYDILDWLNQEGALASTSGGA